MHRLNRAEYDNTVRDLLQTDLQPARTFPEDDFGNGFDNQAAVLSMSPLHVEMYEAAADDLVQRGVLAEQALTQQWRIEAESEQMSAGAGGPSADGWNLWSNGFLKANVDLPGPGTYLFRVRAYGQQGGPDPAQMAMGIDQAQLIVVDVPNTSDSPGVFELSIETNAGIHAFEVWFVNDYYEEGVADRNLVIDWFDIEGPIGVTADRPAGYDLVFGCDPGDIGEDACAAQIAREFGARAFRRPVESDELSRLLQLYAMARGLDADFEEAVGVMVKAMLVSPHFLYRVEVDRNPTSAKSRELNAYELASRLSYFLWSSMPDDRLLQLADEGSLLEDDVLAQQVQRMLRDDKSSALVDNLAGQWLYTRSIDNVSPDYMAFPEWDDNLKISMKEEMRLFLTPFFLEDRNMLELLTAEDTWVDSRLAQHYGWEEPLDGLFTNRPIPDGFPRAGLLSQGGLMTALSYPTRTSPVRRGAWVLTNLMCEAPPPPPPGVEGLIEQDQQDENESFRDRMERHRADPICASCHQSMDPIGFALEEYDGVGVFRDFDQLGNPIDASGRLTDGFEFVGVEELGAHLAQDRRLPRCMAQKTWTYALGRAPTVEDIVYLDAVQNRFASGGHSFGALAEAIVLSEPFRRKTGEPEVAP